MSEVWWMATGRCLRQTSVTGSMPGETERNPGGRPEKTPTDKEEFLPPPSLDELGIDWKLSARARKPASIPDNAFGAELYTLQTSLDVVG
jgi:hypothetical protein